MEGSYYGEEELKDMFNSALEKQRFKTHYAIDKFLNLLFWKDYGEGHISTKLKQEIFDVLNTIKTHGSEGETYYSIDVDKAIEVINKIREKIGMKLLYKKHRSIFEEHLKR